MAEEYRYPLTRICLRNGALTLPRTMLGLFPEEGAITAVDTESGDEFQLAAAGPRTITGLGAFLDAHGLEVNDELLIRPLEDGRFGFTAQPRARKRDYARPRAVTGLLDELAQAELAANESEVRALYPDLPQDFDLRGALEADGRFVYFEGRWHARAALERRIDDEQARRIAAGRRPGQGRQPRAGEAAAEPGVGEREATAEPEAAPVVRSVRAEQAAAEPAGGEPADPGLAGSGQVTLEPVTLDPASVDLGTAEVRPLEAGETHQEALWRSTWQPPSFEDAGSAAAPGAATDADHRSSGPSVRERRAPRTVFPGDAALSREDEGEDEAIDLQHVGRARELLQAFGFRVEALGQGDLMAHAELGRRGYTVLVHVLAYGQRLDWAALLARRREVAARYLAVFGDRRDLNRLQSPAELARATLWSWEGLHRARTLGHSVPISPFDLQRHFEREGLFGHGLERFEGDVTELVAERGAFSEVLTSLAALRAPTVFLLEELAAEGTLSRDAVLKVLERLVEAPFHLVARVAQGEFCLRRPVADGLANLADYATSLRGRLPSRGRERLTGLGEPELLQEDELFDDADVDARGDGEDAGEDDGPDHDGGLRGGPSQA
ncbi:MAG TPA: hypothetical protein VKA00_08595 [Trueperaceae bacterium]|nr:hypothetical protein [Trueperaceae bacterium]